MADNITTGLPTLSPEEKQAQRDRARIAAMRGPVERALDTGANALFDAGTLLPRALVGLGNQLIRVPNAFGAGIPAQRLPGDAPDALPEFRLAPYSTAQNTGSVGGSWGPPLPAAPAAAPVTVAPYSNEARSPAPVPAPIAPRTPKSSGTKTAASMPAGAPAPLVPDLSVVSALNALHQQQNADAGMGATFSDGVTYINKAAASQDPAWLTRFNARTQQFNELGAQLPAANGGAIEVYRPGYARTMALPQLGYSEVDQGVYATQTAATGGMGAYIKAAAEGQQRATDPLAVELEKARITGEYGLKGHQASAAGTVGAAKLGSDARRYDVDATNTRFYATPQVLGEEEHVTPTSVTKTQTRGMPQKDGSTPKPLAVKKPVEAPPDGTRVRLKDNRMATIVNGQPVPDN